MTTKHNRRKPRATGANGSNCRGKSVTDTYSVTQINLKRKYNAWGTLLTNIHGRKNPIILATEPYTNNKHLMPNINKDLISVYCNKGEVRPRAAIVLHKSLESKCWKMHDYTTPDQAAVKIKLDNIELILASTYMDINGPVPPHETSPLATYANNNKIPLIIGTDTNSHHTLWGNKACNSRGEELLDFLSSLGLHVANKGSTPTFLNSRGQNSVIDLTITNQAGGDLVSNWHVSDLFSNSDHKYIMFDITTGRKSEPRQIRLVKNTDWKKFESLIAAKTAIHTRYHELSTKEQIDNSIAELNSIIKEAFEESCPPTYISSAIKKPPWLSPEIEEAQRGIRHKLMTARNNKSYIAWAALRESNKQYNKLLNKTQQQAWRTFCQETESIKESARMNKILKSCNDTKEKLESVYKEDGTLTSTAEQTLEVMAQVHFRDCPNDPPITSSTPLSTSKDLTDKIYSLKRLEEAVKSFEPYKAAGPDTIKPILIQKAWPHIQHITRNIMIRNHELQHIPSLWRESAGIFIPKPGKTDYNHPKSYRTITLSPVMLKLQEKAILWHMQHDLNIAKNVSKRQYGFKKGCSTEAALHKVAHTIERRIAKKGFVLGVFLDIEGAFDNVSFKAISEAIRNTEVDASTAQWIINMVTNRFISITHKQTTKRIRVKRGCPQGGILSPFLWNLVIDDLLNYSAKDIPGYLQAFADDLASLAEGNDLEVIWERTQRTITTIENWCLTKGLSVSTLKTKIVMFTWNRKWTLRPIMVGNTPIELSPYAKFLGVTLDSKLNYNEHVTKITNKATASLMQCKKAVGPTWGLTPKTCKWLYTTVIRPILTYCVSIWIRATHTKHNAKKIERVQALALRIMSGAMPSTPFNTLNHITNTINIIPFLQGEAAKGASRLLGYGDWTSERRPSCKGTIKAHSTINNDFLDTLPIPKTVLRDLTRPSMKLESKFTIENPINDLEEYRKTLDNIIKDIPDKTITCYTDGSRTDSGSGAGYIITTENNNITIKESHFKLPDYSTVFQAELIAIKEACNYLTSQNNKDKDIIIWTDSLSSIQALANITSRSITVNDCYNALQNIATHNNVTIKWVAAHTGIWGNEKADSLAKAGTTSTSLIKCPIPQSHIKTLIDNKVNNLNNDLWKTNGHSHTDKTLGNKHKNIIKQLNTTLICSRKKYRIAVHLITGHCTLNKHLHTIRKVNSSICSNCQLEDETVSHFLGQCPSTSTIRSNFFHDYTMDITEIFDKFPLTTIINFTTRTQRFKEPEHLDQSGVT